MKKIITLVVGAIFFLNSFTSIINAQSQDPKDILLKKYPKEVIKIIKTVDLNNDQKNENFILTKSGNFFLVNSKGVVVLINTGIGEYEEDEVGLKIFSVSAKEKHVALTVEYLPSNTQLFVYRLQDGTLNKKIELIADVGVEIDNKGRIHQNWKDYKPEGGWDTAEGIFTWNSKTNKYTASGKYVLQ
ncbi:hypothetical protein [Paenibacillus donghaensis]|uniref:Uncharacterized protein n=1 Tax=Paenibacillus donghaensis TaxID=414771 RepID=A0A2Z2KHF7_9BACL|nr:hypothetical protein [Paenibacillus donghaensis]ASA23515.1 hypothetical protein B9T62_23565 [Paenibacillus donghaensis]